MVKRDGNSKVLAGELAQAVLKNGGSVAVVAIKNILYRKHKKLWFSKASFLLIFKLLSG